MCATESESGCSSTHSASKQTKDYQQFQPLNPCSRTRTFVFRNDLHLQWFPIAGSVVGRGGGGCTRHGYGRLLLKRQTGHGHLTGVLLQRLPCFHCFLFGLLVFYKEGEASIFLLKHHKHCTQTTQTSMQFRWATVDNFLFDYNEVLIREIRVARCLLRLWLNIFQVLNIFGGLNCGGYFENIILLALVIVRTVA